MSTNESNTSLDGTYTNLAQRIAGGENQTPIARAIAEYILSLLHSNPKQIYSFGNLSSEVKTQVSDITNHSVQNK